MAEQFLTLTEARELMLERRARARALRKLKHERWKQWCAEHPEITSLWDREVEIRNEPAWLSLEAISEYDPRPLTHDEEKLLAESRAIHARLDALLPNGIHWIDEGMLTEAERAELHDALSQAEKLRRRLPRPAAKIHA
jgi:hypothetical protein